MSGLARRLALALLAAALASNACDKGGIDQGPAPASQPAAVPPPSASGAPAVGPSPGEPATTLAVSEVRASLPPLPVVPFAPPRSSDEVRLAYEFAGLHPEVLKYVPCFCGCERSGHPHNESCFVAERDPQGRVVSWDTHGMG